MVNTLLSLLAGMDPGNIATVLGVAGGLIVFLGWRWRLHNLEIEKLKLEIGELRERQSRIIRPTADQIRDVKNRTLKDGVIKLSIDGSQDVFATFIADFQIYLTVLLAYLGDSNARTEIWQSKLQAAMTHRIDPYPLQIGDDGEPQFRFPEPKPLVDRWTAMRGACLARVPADTIREIDRTIELIERMS